MQRIDSLTNETLDNQKNSIHLSFSLSFSFFREAKTVSTNETLDNQKERVDTMSQLTGLQIIFPSLPCLNFLELKEYRGRGGGGAFRADPITVSSWQASQLPLSKQSNRGRDNGSENIELEYNVTRGLFQR